MRRNAKLSSIAAGLWGVFWITLLVAAPAWAQGQGQEPALPAEVEPSSPQAAVTIDGINIFMVKGRILSFSPEERARAIAGRINRVAASLLFDERDLALVTHEGGSDVVAGDIIIMTVSDADAAAEKLPREQLAGQRLEQIREAIASYRQLRSTKQLMAAILYTLAASAALLAALLLTGWLFRRLRARIDGWLERLTRSVRARDRRLLSEERLAGFFRLLLSAVRLVVILLLLDFYLVYVLSLFPWSRALAVKLTGYLMAPLRHLGTGFLAALPNLLFVAVVIFLTYLVTRCARFFFHELGNGTIEIRGFQQDWADSTYKIVRFLLIVMCLVIIFPYLPGSESAAFRGISVFVGVLLSLGSSSAISNVIAGVILTYTGAFRPGDRVRIAETVGDVVEKTLLVTRVRTVKNVEITIPNAMVLSSHLVNYSSMAHSQSLILHTTVTIGYDAPWRKVHEALLAAARATDNILLQPEPFVLQTALNDFYVSYELNAYTDRPHAMAMTYSCLHQNIQDQFNEAGIEIMSPHYSALRDGNRTTIPEDYLAKDYQPPSFRV